MSAPRFTFDATFSDGSPRRLAGTWRPPWSDIRNADVRTSTGEHVFYNDNRGEMWREGQFDHPIYHLEEGE